MNFNEHDIKKVAVILVILVLGILTFLLLKPVLISIIAGLILAYIFYPIYNFMLSRIRNRTGSALLVSVIVLLIIIVPLWFIIPIMLQQVFDIFSAAQSIDFLKIAEAIFPTTTPQFAAQLSITLNNFVSQLTSGILKSLTSFFLDLPTITLQLFIVCFVFYYALKDGDLLRKFVSEISPFNKIKEKILVDQFKGITDSVVYGQIIIGLIQGGLAGLGFLIFGVKNALILTTLAIFFAILPIVGPFLVWIPITIYLFSTGSTGVAIGYLLYNLIIVSTVDNFLRTYLISRKTNISPAIILVSMIGGFLIFGIIGLILGPLIAAYLILFLQAYKDKTLSHLFSNPETK